MGVLLNKSTVHVAKCLFFTSRKERVANIEIKKRKESEEKEEKKTGAKRDRHKLERVL